MRRSMIIIVVCLVVFMTHAAAPKSNTARQPIIDMHMHCYGTDERWAAKVPNPITNQPMTATNEKALMEATIAQMDRYNVVKAVISGNEVDYEAELR